jgi:small GTP-binding protein
MSDISPMKVILVGDHLAGKTCLVCYRATNSFDLTAVPTVMTTRFQITERVMGTPVHLDVCDTAGQERYRSLTISHFRDAHAALLCFDSTCGRGSILEWVGHVSAHAGPSCVIFLVATKVDLLLEDREEFISSGERFAEDHELYGFFMTSAKTGEGVFSLFERVAGQHPRFRPETVEVRVMTPSVAIAAKEKEGGECC